MIHIFNTENQIWWKSDHELGIRFSGGFQLLTASGTLFGGVIAAFIIQQRVNCAPSDHNILCNISTAGLIYALGATGIAYTAFSWWLSRHLATRIDLATGNVHGWLRTYPGNKFRVIGTANAFGGTMITLTAMRPFGPTFILGYRFSEHETTTLLKLLSEALTLPVVHETDSVDFLHLEPRRWQQRLHTGFLLFEGSAFIAVTLACQAIFVQHWPQSLKFAPVAILCVTTGVMMIRYALTPPELRGKHMLGYRIQLAFGCLCAVAVPIIVYKELSQSIHQFFNAKSWSVYLVKARENPPYMLGANIALALAFLRSGWKLRNETLRK